jgi:glycosyltransferase involved in cell wall biosynthesis
MQGTFLEQTIRSVLLQGYSNLEYLIFDGGSTDESVEIIRKYEPWIAYWHSAKDAGQADAINRAWRAAKGEYFAWINSDDWYQPGAFAAMADVIRAAPDTDWIMGPVDDCWADGTFIKRHQPREMTLAELLGRNEYGLQQPGTFFRRNLIDKVGPLDAALHHSFDHDFWARCLTAGLRFRSMETPVAFFRRHNASKTTGNVTRSMREDRLVFERYERSLGETERRQAWQWLCAYEADLLIPGVYQLLAGGRRGAALRLLVTHAHLIPFLHPPKLWFGAAWRVLYRGLPPVWFAAR